jgi:hypothetical protein
MSKGVARGRGEADLAEVDVAVLPIALMKFWGWVGDGVGVV